MDRNLEYYLNKYYRTEISKIPDEEGGGYFACLPQFGQFGIVGDGESPEEAISNLQEVKEERFKEYLEEGIQIPEPEEELTFHDFSGKFLTRVPKFLHKELVIEAKKNCVSLNQFVSTLLASSLQEKKISSDLSSIKDEFSQLQKCICDLDYKIDSRMQMKMSGLTSNFYDDDYSYKKAA